MCCGMPVHRINMGYANFHRFAPKSVTAAMPLSDREKKAVLVIPTPCTRMYRTTYLKIWWRSVQYILRQHWQIVSPFDMIWGRLKSAESGQVRGIFWFWHFIHLSLTYLLKHLLTAPGPTRDKPHITTVSFLVYSSNCGSIEIQCSSSHLELCLKSGYSDFFLFVVLK